MFRMLKLMNFVFDQKSRVKTTNKQKNEYLFLKKFILFSINFKALRERFETINHLNEQLQNCQRQYNDLLNTSSLESFNLTEVKRQLNHMTEDKDKLEFTCQELQVYLSNYTRVYQTILKGFLIEQISYCIK